MKKKGSLSVFSALTIMLVAAVLFTFLEGGRLLEERRVLQANTDSALESVFAGYDLAVWKDYHLLMRSVGGVDDILDLQEISEEISEITESSMNPGNTLIGHKYNNFFRSKLSGVAINNYTLVTDGEGAAFQNLVISYMKSNIAEETLQRLKDLYDRQESMESVDVDEALQEAKDGIKSAKKEAKEEKKGEKKEKGKGSKKQGDQKSGKVKDSPLKALIKIKKMGVLTLVLPEEDDLSSKEADSAKLVSHRKLTQGSATVQTVNGWREKLLVQQYYANHFADYQKPREDGYLQYEKEYLIGGKNSDAENLKSCVNKILLAREAANLAAIAADGKKMSEIQELALLLAGATANPIIIEAVSGGIMAAWAFAESILDLRTLLGGGRVALVKDAVQWTSDAEHLSQCISEDFKAKNCTGGLSYSDYIDLLLYTEKNSALSLRALDLIESAMWSKGGYENFHIDHMMISAEVCAEYEFSQNFLSLTMNRQLRDRVFALQCNSVYSYMKAGE